MGKSFDVIVVGLGAMGSAVACELARRGRTVLGIDRFSPPHAYGSSHGETRIIREAYFEHPLYVPLVRRAYDRWAALERDTGTPLLVPTGGLMIGLPGSQLVEGALESARAHGLAHDVLAATEVARRHPALRPRSDWVGVWEPRAGVLFPERCIEVHLQMAARHGAELRLQTPVLSWRAEDGRAIVMTVEGAVTAESLVVAAGAWMPGLVAELSTSLAIERQVLHWFRPRAHRDVFAADRLPVFLLEHARGSILYGIPEFPEVGAGVKVAHHHDGEQTSAERVRREVMPAEVDAMHPLLAQFLPDLVGGWQRASVCMYTNASDEHFVIDWHPEHSNVLLLSPCSGHGFKFATVVGELAADLLTAGECRFDLTPFRFDRLRRLS